VEQGDVVEIADVRARIECQEPLVLINKTRGIEIPLNYELSERQKGIVLAGGLLGG
jgi:aconitate hydratase